jgi:hypothetical protein
MFSLASGVYDSYFAAPQLNILVIGCESVGKTTLLERLKVTEFSTKPQKNNVGSTRRLTCPAPKRYSQTEVDDNEEEMAMNVVGTSQLSSKPNGSSHVVTQQSSIESLEDVSLETPKQVQDLEPEIEEKFEEFNVKKGSSMLPMVKIRPTSTYFFLVDWFHDFVGLCVFYHASHFHFVSTPHMKKKAGPILRKFPFVVASAPSLTCRESSKISGSNIMVMLTL